MFSDALVLLLDSTLLNPHNGNIVIGIDHHLLNCNLLQDKPSLSRARDVEEVVQVIQMDSPVTSFSATTQSQPPSQLMGADSPSSAHISEYEDAESDHATCVSAYIKRNLMQHIFIKQVPDTTLSLRCGSMMIE